MQNLQIVKLFMQTVVRFMQHDLVTPVMTSLSGRRLRSADSLNLVRPRCRLKFGERGFAVAAPEAWNSLPVHVKSSSSLTVFKDRLKTELFTASYVLPLLLIILCSLDYGVFT